MDLQKDMECRKIWESVESFNTWFLTGEFMTKRENFEHHGPIFLAHTHIDWENLHHRSCVTSSLVQGVYVLEQDRNKKRQGHDMLAPPWWKSFHFELVDDPLVDDSGSIFGAIYEYQSQNSSSSNSAPKYVIAFRGTLLKRGSWFRDLKLDIKIIFNRLHKDRCFEIGMHAVENIKVDLLGGSSIWLAGHSLGSAMAMLIGKNTAKMNCPIETYLFNPPFISIPIERIKDPKKKDRIRRLKSGLAAFFGHLDQGPQYDQLSSWVPFLFVNPSDIICSEYIGHFERGENLAMEHPIRNSILRLAGKNPEPLMHVLPSAHLSINQSHTTNDFTEAHGLHQWWRSDLHCQSKEFHFRMREFEATST